MDLRVGGFNCAGSVADEPQTSMLYDIVLDFWFFAPFLNQSIQKASGVDNMGKIVHFLTPVIVERSVGIILATRLF